VSAKLGLPTSRPAFCFLASLVLAQPKTKPNFFTSPKTIISNSTVPVEFLLIFAHFHTFINNHLSIINFF